MFRDREDAAHRLAAAMHDFALLDPLVLAIPRGGVVTGAILSHELGAELDVVLSRKLRAPGHPEFAVGAISEKGEVHFNARAVEALGVSTEYLEREKAHQLSELARARRLFRSVRPEASISGRSVIVTDDGVATGSTLMAALQSVEAERPYEVIVAVPVAPLNHLPMLRKYCDAMVCLDSVDEFWAVGQFYEDFSTVDDEYVLAILRKFAWQAA